MFCIECKKDFATFLGYLHHECPIAQAEKEKREAAQGKILSDRDYCACGHQRFWHKPGEGMGRLLGASTYTEKMPGSDCDKNGCLCEAFTEMGAANAG